MSRGVVVMDDHSFLRDMMMTYFIKNSPAGNYTLAVTLTY